MDDGTHAYSCLFLRIHISLREHAYMSRSTDVFHVLDFHDASDLRAARLAMASLSV